MLYQFVRIMLNNKYILCFLYESGVNSNYLLLYIYGHHTTITTHEHSYIYTYANIRDIWSYVYKRIGILINTLL